jgi:hypothetical protein
MRTRGSWLAATAAIFALALSFAGTSLAQTTVDVRNFEVLSVDGNNLVVRDQNGTHEYTVPDDFRFTVDGRKLSVKDLKPGMKGTATVTTKTTVTPVTVTELREATVVDATDFTVTVRGQDGVKRFTQPQLDDRGVQILRDGKLIRIRDLRKGDVINATVISKAAPVVLTETEVQATLAQSKPAGAAPATTTASSAAPTTTTASSAAPATSPPPSAAEPPKATQPPTTEGTSPWIWYVLIAVAFLLAWLFVARKKKS